MAARKRYKHAILAGMVMVRPSKQAKAQIRNWYSQRDYSFIANLDEQGYARELEVRLHLLQTLTSHKLYLSPETGLEQIHWKHSCHATSAELTRFDREDKNKKGNLVYVEKGDYLNGRHKLAGQFQEPLPKLVDEMPLKAIPSHTKQTQVALARQEYLCPLEAEGKQILLSIDLARGSNKAILDETLLILTQMRNELDVPEPSCGKANRNNKAMSPFINKYAIEYLDLLIYCIKPEMTATEAKAFSGGDKSFETTGFNQYWNLSDSDIAQIIAPLELDGETIKKWRTRFFEEKLFDGEHMRPIFLNLNSLLTT